MISVNFPTPISVFFLFTFGSSRVLDSAKFGSLILCVISLTYHRSDQSLCPLCLLWFLPLPRQQDCILAYILPTKPKRAEVLAGGNLTITRMFRLKFWLKSKPLNVLLLSMPLPLVYSKFSVENCLRPFGYTSLGEHSSLPWLPQRADCSTRPATPSPKPFSRKAHPVYFCLNYSPPNPTPSPILICWT